MSTNLALSWCFLMSRFWIYIFARNAAEGMLCSSVFVVISLLGCHDKVPQTEWFIVLESESPRSSFWLIQFLVRDLFLTCRWLLLHYILIRWRERTLLSLSFRVRTPTLLSWGLTLMTLFNFHHFLKALSPSTVILGVSLQHMNFVGGGREGQNNSINDTQLQHFSPKQLD